MSDYQQPDRDNRSRRVSRRPGSFDQERTLRPGSHDQEPTRRPRSYDQERTLRPSSYSQDPPPRQSPPPRPANRSRPVDDEPDRHEDEPQRREPAPRGQYSSVQGRRRRDARGEGSRSRAIRPGSLPTYPASSSQDAPTYGTASEWEDSEPQPNWSNGSRGRSDGLRDRSSGPRDRSSGPRDWNDGPRDWEDEDWGSQEYSVDGGQPRRPSSVSSRRNGYADDEDYSAASSSRGRPYPQYRGDERPGGTTGWWEASRQWASVQGRRLLGTGTLAAQDGASTRPGLLGTRRRRIIAIVIVACILASSLTAVVQVLQVSAFAHSGLQHLKNAEADLKTLQKNPFDSQSIQAAYAEFAAANSDFSGINARLNLVGIASGAPKVGSKISGAQKLLPIAVEATQAGMLACDMLNTLVTSLKHPFGTGGGGLTTAQYAIIADKWAQLHPLIETVIGQLGQLTPSDLSLDPRLGPLVAQFTSQLPQITQLVNDFDGVIAALPQLLGVEKPSTYLMLLLDSSELRPTGGFIGNFGALAVNKGQVDSSQFHISDITLIDSSVKFPVGNCFNCVAHGQVIQIPSNYAWFKSIFKAGSTDSWSLRDSNLDPNYPTASKDAINLYQQLQQYAQENLKAQNSSVELYNPQTSGDFAGVITLSYGFFQQALNITGKITVDAPGIHETVTSANFVTLIHHYALSGISGPDNQACGTTSCSKVFTSDVVNAFMAKIKANLPAYIGQLGKLFIDSLRTKDIEIFINEPKTEQTLIDLGLGATVQAPATGDSVFEVEANIGGNKDNYFLKYQMSDQITVDQSGDATHHLSWKYTWPNDQATIAEAFAAGSVNYHSYSRVFVPPAATLISQSNLAEFGQSSASADTFNRKVFDGAAYAYFGRTNGYAVSWKTPGVVTHDSTGYHYHLLFQREAGILWPLTLTISLPACAQVTGTPQVSGLTPLNLVTVKGTTVTVTGPLTEDEQIQVNYTC